MLWLRTTKEDEDLEIKDRSEAIAAHRSPAQPYTSPMATRYHFHASDRGLVLQVFLSLQG